MTRSASTSMRPSVGAIGSQPLWTASTTSGLQPGPYPATGVRTHDADPGRVTPIAFPLSSPRAGPRGDVTLPKFLPSPCVPPILTGDPAPRNCTFSVEPVTPIRTSPTITAL